MTQERFLKNTYVWLLAFTGFAMIVLHWTLTTTSDLLVDVLGPKINGHMGVYYGTIVVMYLIWTRMLWFVDMYEVRAAGYQTDNWGGIGLWFIPVYMVLRCRKTDQNILPVVAYSVLQTLFVAFCVFYICVVPLVA